MSKFIIIEKPFGQDPEKRKYLLYQRSYWLIFLNIITCCIFYALIKLTNSLGGDMANPMRFGYRYIDVFYDSEEAIARKLKIEALEKVKTVTYQLR